MTITAKQLADGQLPNAAAALYTAPGATTVYIREIVLYNTDAAAVDCTLAFVEAVSGDTRVIAYVELGSKYTFHFNDPLVLDTGDAIEGDDGGGGGNLVDYTIYGATEA